MGVKESFMCAYMKVEVSSACMKVEVISAYMKVEISSFVGVE